MDNKVILTQEGLKKLQEELEDLKVNKRAEIADEIREAKAQGDLSENYEYTAAKEAQADLEARIAEIEHILNHAEVIEEAEDKAIVNVGSTVTLKNMETEEKEEYTIVGSTEADPFEGKISNESPLGRELLNKKKNAVVEFMTPAETTITYKILKIQ
ncbi:MAG: transcription elongation factor GreA [Clostridia bacterium]|nr:transcription elongation factor GreA [Clostridia bacterium]